MKKLKRNTFFAGFIIFLFGATSVFSETAPLLPTSLPLPKAGKIPKFVNVALLVDVPVAHIVTEGSYEIRSKDSSNLLTQSQRPLKAEVRPRNGGIEINHQIYQEKNLILSVATGAIQVEKRKYDREIQVLKTSESTITVINRIDLEEYLKGVLPLEVHFDWPMEALKAQAVISRTFALFKVLEKKDLDFSLRDTVESQVYGGALFHQSSTDQAVDLTRGEILTFQGKIFPSYFHAVCGGRTAQADRIWRVQPNPVLNGVACSFCGKTKYSKWTLKVPLAQIESIMQKKGYPAKQLKRVSFLNRDPSGRASKVLLEYQSSKLTISAGDFRSFIGNDRLRSLKVDVVIDGKAALFHGHGWGHGIGFCQWGSKRQADLGKTYREITQFYFPGSEIKKV